MTISDAAATGHSVDLGRSDLR